jgi:kynurenine formamidase
MADLRALWNTLECVDLSVPLSEEFPVSWPGLPPFRKRVLNWFENYREPNGEEVRSLGHFYDQSLELDEHTGTHMDFPAHILAPQALAEYDKAFAQGSLLRTFAGPAIVLDATADLNQAPAGISPRVSVETALAWERQNGSIESGDIVLINTGYMDHYFAAFPEGRRLVHEGVESKSVPGWPVPSDECFRLLGERGVRHVGIASPSMGALDDALGTHLAGLAQGITFAEGLVNLGKVPARGGLYVGLPLKISGQSGSPIRAVAFVPKEGKGIEWDMKGKLPS